MKYVFPVLTVILLIILVGVGAYFFGKQQKPSETSTVAIPTAGQVESSPTLTPTVMEKQTQTLSAGGILVFNAYTLSTPEGWVSVKEQTKDVVDKLTLSKLGYKLTIYQAAFGGGGCLYPGDKPSEMAQTYVSFTEIKDENGFVFRRGQNESSPNTYTYCQKNTSDGSFGSPTSFGAISLTTPGTPDKNAIIFPEADFIVASLKKQ